MEKEHLAQIMENLILSGNLTKEDLMPLIKHGTSQMLGKPEDKIFIKTSDEEKREFILDKFMSFVEDEAHRIYEERNGAYRRDGGRKMNCQLFLNKIIEELK